jgi:hypothetical protein
MGPHLHPPVGWTLETWAAHSKDMREMQDKLDAMNDRRLTEVQVEREKALRIKERADDKALDLARQIQSYKDEKANELREQISSERGEFASTTALTAAMDKIEAQLKPINDFIAQAQGRGQGVNSSWQTLVAVGGLIVTMLMVGGTIVSVALYVTRQQVPVIQTQPLSPAVPVVPMR